MFKLNRYRSGAWEMKEEQVRQTLKKEKKKKERKRVKNKE